MKKAKISLSKMIGKLTRNEMRGVMAGSGFKCTCANGVTWTSYSAANCVDICSVW